MNDFFFFFSNTGEWWKRDIKEVLEEATQAQNDPVSDAFTINGQPGDLYPCSKSGEGYSILGMLYLRCLMVS